MGGRYGASCRKYGYRDKQQKIKQAYVANTQAAKANRQTAAEHQQPNLNGQCMKPARKAAERYIC